MRYQKTYDHEDGQNVSIYSQDVSKNRPKPFENLSKFCASKMMRCTLKTERCTLHVGLHWGRNPSKIDLKSIPEPSGVRFVGDTTGGTSTELNLNVFWNHLNDFGCPFGSSRAPRASQNSACWHQVALKSDKKRRYQRKP